MVKRYPHSIAIKYNAGGFPKGEYVPGFEVQKTTVCRIEPAERGNQYKSQTGGDMITNEWNIFSPLFTGYDEIPLSAIIISTDTPLAFKNKEHLILAWNVFQKHIEIKV